MENQQQPIANFNFSSSKSDDFTGWHDVKTKTIIVTRLFNQGHINFSEAAILLKEFVVIEKPEPKEGIDFFLQTIPKPNFETTCSYSDDKENINKLNSI